MTINDTHPPSYRRTGKKEKLQKTLIKKSAAIGSNAILFLVVIGQNAVMGAG